MFMQVLAENIRIIDDRSEKIDGVHDSEVRPETIYPRVVGGFRSDQHIDVVKLRQAVQNLHEVGGAELGGSTRGLDLLRQPDCLVFSEVHRKSTLILLMVYFNAKGICCPARPAPAYDPSYFPTAGEDFRRRTSPILMVSPSRSKYSKSGIVYLRLEPMRSRNDAAVISPFSEINFLRTALT